METDSTELLSIIPQQDASNTETLKLDSLLKNESIPTCGSSPQCQNIVPNDIIINPQHTIISMPENTSITSAIVASSSRSTSSTTHEAVDVKSSDLAIKESATQYAIKFFLKKSKGVFGAIKVYLNKPVSAKGSKFKSFLSSLKNFVQKTLSKNTPSTKSNHQISLKDFPGFSLSSLTNKRKKIKNGGNMPILPLNFKQKSVSETFLNPVRKPELQQMEGFQFAKPKVYECSYCDTRFFKLPVYLKHIRQHAERNPEVIRCETCSKAFSTVINKKRHQLQCQKRAIL